MPGTRPSAQDTILQQVLGEFTKVNSELAALRAELKSFKENLEPIVKLIRGEGDVPSIPTQIALLVQSVVDVKADIKENKDDVERVKSRQDTSDKSDKGGKIVLWTAVITGVFGTIGVIISAILKISN